MQEFKLSEAPMAHQLARVLRVKTFGTFCILIPHQNDVS